MEESLDIFSFFIPDTAMERVLPEKESRGKAAGFLRIAGFAP